MCTINRETVMKHNVEIIHFARGPSMSSAL